MLNIPYFHFNLYHIIPELSYQEQTIKEPSNEQSQVKAGDEI
jgi:hypothetical protein